MINCDLDLIKAASEALTKMLTHQMERNLQPSFYDMFYRGFALGLFEGKDFTKEDVAKLHEWHYIELEGNPTTDDKCCCLLQCDDYKDIEMGWYDYETNSWHLEYYPSCFHKVIAYHILPKLPD